MRHRSIEYLTDRRFTPTTWENPTSDTNMESIISNLQHKLTGLESKYNQFVGQCAKIFKDNQLRSLNDSISEDPSTFQLMQELSSDRNKFDKELNSMMNFQSSRTETDLQELFKKITIKLSEAKDRAIHVLPQRGDYREKVNEVFIDLLENLYMTVFNKDKQKETNSWIRNIMDLEDNKRNLGRTQRDYHDKNLKKIEDKAKKYKAQWERISEEKQSLEVKVKELQDLLNKKTNEVARIDQRYQNLQLKYENSSDEIEKIREELTDANKKNLKLERSLAAPRSTSKHRAKNLSPGYDEFRRTTVPIKTFLASDGFNNINLKLELERTYEEIKRIREERDALKLWKDHKSHSLTQDYEQEKASFQLKLNNLQERLLSFSNVAKNLIDNSLQADKTNKEPASLDKSSQCRKELRNKIREIKAENPTKTNIESPMLSPLGSPKSGSPRSRGTSSKIDMSLIIKNKQNLEKEITRLEGVVDYERKQADKYCEVLEEKNRELNEKTKIIEEINAECNRLKSELELINKETTVIIANLEHREKSVTNDLKNSEIILNDLNKQLEDFNTNHSDCNHNQTITSDYKTFKKNIPIMLKSLEESLFSKITSISQKVTDKSNDLDQAFKKYRDHIDDLKNSKSAEEEYILSLEEKVEHLDFMLQQSQELNLGTITDLDEDVKQLENQKKEHRRQFEILEKENQDLKDAMQKYSMIEDQLKDMEDLQRHVELLEEKLREYLKEKIQKSLEIDQLKYENNSLNEEKAGLLKECEEKDKEVMALQGKFQSDIRNANSNIERLVYEISLAKQSKTEAESLLGNEKTEDPSEIERLKQMLDQSNKIIQDYELNSGKEMSQMRSQLNDIREMHKSSRDQNEHLTSHINKLNDELEKSNEKLDEESKKSQKLEALLKENTETNVSTIKALQNQLEILKNKKKTYKEKLKISENDNCALTSNLETLLDKKENYEKELKLMINQLEIQIKDKDEEIDDYKFNLDKKDNEISDILKQKTENHDEINLELLELRRSKAQMEHQIEKLTSKHQSHVEELASSKSLINDKENEILNLKNTNKQYQDTNNNLCLEINKYKNDMEALNLENLKLAQEYAKKTDEMTEIENSLKSKIVYLQSVNKEYGDKIYDLESSVEKLAMENITLAGTLKTKTDEFSALLKINSDLKFVLDQDANNMLALKNKSNQSEASLNQTENTLKTQLKNNEKLVSQLEKFELESKEKIANLDYQKSLLESELALHEASIKRLENNNNDLTADLSAKQTVIISLGSELKQKDEIISNFQTETNEKDLEIQRLSQIIDNSRTLSENSYQSLSELSQKEIEKLKIQIGMLNSLKDELNSEILIFKPKILRLEKENEENQLIIEETHVAMNAKDKEIYDLNKIREMHEISVKEKQDKITEISLSLTEKNKIIENYSQMLKSEIETASSQSEKFKCEKNTLAELNEKLKSEISKLNIDIKSKEFDIFNLNDENNELKSEKIKKEDKIKHLEKEITTVLSSKEKIIQDYDSQISAFTNLLNQAKEESHQSQLNNLELLNKLRLGTSTELKSGHSLDEPVDELRSALRQTVDKIEKEKNDIQIEYENKLNKLEKDYENLKLEKNFVQVSLDEASRDLKRAIENNKKLIEKQEISDKIGAELKNDVQDLENQNQELVEKLNKFEDDKLHKKAVEKDDKNRDVESEISDIVIDVLGNPPFKIENNDDLAIIRQCIGVLLAITDIVKLELSEAQVILPQSLRELISSYKNQIAESPLEPIDIDLHPSSHLTDPIASQPEPLEGEPADQNSAVFESGPMSMIKALRIENIEWKLFINAGGAYEWQAEEMPLPITEEPDEDLEIIKAELGEYYKDSILKSIKSLIELSTGKVPKASSFSFNEDLDFIPEGEGEHISFDSLSFRNEFGAGLGLTPVIEVTEQDESLEKTNGNIQREFELLKTELARKINKIQEQKRDIERHEEQSFVLKAQLRESDEKLQKAQSVDLRYLKNLFQSLLKGIPPLAQEFEQIIKIFYGILGFSSVEENSISMERKGKRGKYDLRLFR